MAVNGPNPGAVYKLLVEVAKLPKAERKEALMPRLEHLWNLCLERTYQNKKGEAVPNPDHATALRVVEVADALLCDAGDRANTGSRLEALKVFDGGKMRVKQPL